MPVLRVNAQAQPQSDVHLTLPYRCHSDADEMGRRFTPGHNAIFRCLRCP